MRFWPVATIVFGVATFAVLVAFSLLPAVRAGFPLGDFIPAMSAFQRAVTPADLTYVFGSPADPARIAAMQNANTLDLYGFIPIYTLFLISGAAMLAGGVRKPVAWLSFAPALIGAAGDLVETTKQLGVTSDWAHAGSYLPIAFACWIKYFGLAVSAAGASALCLAGPKPRFVLAGLGFVPIIATAADFLHVAHVPSLLSIGFAAFWLPLLVVAIRESLSRAS